MKIKSLQLAYKTWRSVYLALIFDAIKNSNTPLIKKILRDDAETLSLEDEQGASLLAYALRQRCEHDVLLLLVDQGLPLDSTDDEGVSVLEYAITYGRKIFIDFLLENGITPLTTQRRSGFTPLMAAVSYNHADIVSKFLEYDLPLNDVDRSGFTALDFARRMHRNKIATILENYIKEHH